jgi:hypothetical protein
MWQFLRENPFLVGALTGGLAAYLLSLLVNHLAREKKRLAYSVTSRKIVERGHRDLEIRYRAEPIERLYSHQIIIRNTGNRALKDLPIRISCNGGRLVEFDWSGPEGADFRVSPQDDHQTLIVNCDLLNRGEHFKVGLTVVSLTLDAAGSQISVVARAENLKCKEITESPFLDPSAFAVNVLATLAERTLRKLW